MGGTSSGSWGDGEIAEDLSKVEQLNLFSLSWSDADDMIVSRSSASTTLIPKDYFGDFFFQKTV